MRLARDPGCRLEGRDDSFSHRPPPATTPRHTAHARPQDPRQVLAQFRDVPVSDNQVVLVCCLRDEPRTLEWEMSKHSRRTKRP